MKELMMMKAGGALVPATSEDAEALAKMKTGRGVRVKLTQVSDRNYKFHKKLFLLFTFCFDVFSERLGGGLKYRGHEVKPSFSTFRSDLTILAGHYEATYSIRGDVKLEPKSVSYSKMEDDEKERLFSDLLNAALRHVLDANMDEATLRNTIDNLMAFDS